MDGHAAQVTTEMKNGTSIPKRPVLRSKMPRECILAFG